MKKGQSSGVEISIFITLLALFILVYVILIPPEQRAELLDDTVISDDDYAEIGDYETVLLSESPGEVHSYQTNYQTNNLESMHLFSEVETSTENIISALTISRTILKDNYKEILFDIDDLELLEKVQLFFLITEADGELTILLNDKLIFEGQLTSNQLPIELSKNYLKKGENTIRLSVNSPGWSIFSANAYVMEDVSLVWEILEKDNEASRNFYIDSDVDVKKGTLKYFVTCNTVTDEGTLTISFNGQEVFDDRVFCSYLDEREITLDDRYYVAGTNTLDFTVDTGNYNLEEIKVETELEESSYPKYSFDIDSNTYEEVVSGDKEVIVKFTFSGSGTKKASVSVQENQFSFDTSSSSYTKDISSMIDNGANSIKIVPKTSFEIDSLLVYVR